MRLTSHIVMQDRHTRDDPYARLGVTPAATRAEINTAYRALLRALHPDLGPTTNEPYELQAVIEAHTLLADPGQRHAYDLSIRKGTPGSGAPASHRPCPLCQGTRVFRQPCHRCAGHGLLFSHGPWLQTPHMCPTCHGSGRQNIPCRTCAATGTT